MSYSRTQIRAVPSHIITGFLGVGKTTAILHLLKSKPSTERWAVLVNEFGEIGIDGRLMQGANDERQDVFVREVPGGCMCCAAGIPMQVALNQLLTIAKPDRLLIEPTGLGHPKEVIQVLLSRAYRKVLNLQQIITMVNARDLNDARCTSNEIFQQQIEVADIVIANKTDLYQPEDKERLQAYIKKNSRPGVKISYTSNGGIDHKCLTDSNPHIELIENDDSTSHHSHAHDHTNTSSSETDTMPVCGYIKKQNQGDEYHSVGWRFREDKIFQSENLNSFLSHIQADRVKAVMNTENGVIGYNVINGSLTEVALFGRGQSCIEIIGSVVDDNWEPQLLQCLAS